MIIIIKITGVVSEQIRKLTGHHAASWQTSSASATAPATPTSTEIPPGAGRRPEVISPLVMSAARGDHLQAGRHKKKNKPCRFAREKQRNITQTSRSLRLPAHVRTRRTKEACRRFREDARQALERSLTQPIRNSCNELRVQRAAEHRALSSFTAHCPATKAFHRSGCFFSKIIFLNHTVFSSRRRR